MKDYLNAEERNQLMVFMSIIQMFNGNRGITGPVKKNIVEDWSSRNNLTKDEQKSLKMAQTYLDKFCKSVYNRMGKREQEAISKRLVKFDFRLIDDYTLQKVYRDFKDRMVNAAVPREQFENWCREIMDIHCKSCKCNYSECPTRLYEIFEDNFIPESGWNLDNCRYAYRAPEGEVNQESVKQHETLRKKLKVV